MYNVKRAQTYDIRAKNHIALYNGLLYKFVLDVGSARGSLMLEEAREGTTYPKGVPPVPFI